MTGLAKRSPPASPRWHIALVVDAADEIPEHLPRSTAVLVGTRRRPKWLAFDCPCGRGHRVMLNLDARRKPRWRVLRDQELAIWPSIDWRDAGVRCHFVIDCGRVLWIAEKRTRK